MVNFYESFFTYDYSFPAVSLAYFLRYPNPYSRHVLSTDVIDRHFDPDTQRLHTTRLHLKRSKLPSAVLKLIPKSLLGASATGDSQAYILETSVVDIREGWMETESRNLEWTGVLSVVEKQVYRRPDHATAAVAGDQLEHVGEDRTEVKTMVTLLSRFGQARRKRNRAKAEEASRAPEQEEKVGFFKSWSTASVQRSIELIGLKRARRSQPNAKEGMKVVLERLREGGLVAVLEGMRRDRELAMSVGAPATFMQKYGPSPAKETRVDEDQSHLSK
jgi:4-amino-4-deoxychorismate lyase